MLSISSSVRPVWHCANSRLSFRARLISGLIFVLSAVAVFFVDWRLRLLAADDSYIHLRIARHLVETGHPYFNANERVMVTSSPLWTVLLAVSTLIFRHIPPAIPLEALFAGGGCTLSFLLAYRLAGSQRTNEWMRRSLLLLLPLFLFTVLLQSSIFQMETPLAVTLLVAGLVLWQSSSEFWFAMLVLAGWTRYEYFFVALLLLAYAVLTKQISRKALTAGGVTFAVGCVWLLSQFGTLIPNTMKAKAVAYVIPWTVSYDGLGLGLVHLSPLILVIFVIVFSRSAHRRISVPHVLMAAGIGLAILYVTRKTFIFPWYQPLVFAPVILGLMLGPFLEGKTWLRVFALCAAVMLLRVHRQLPEEILAALTGQPGRDQADIFNARTNEYVLVGKAIESVCPQARLMTSEIGGLGNGFRGEILDGLGLASPAAIRFHPMAGSDRASGAIPYGFVLEEKPDVIVSYDLWSESLRRNYDPTTYRMFDYASLPASEARFSMPLPRRLYVLVADHGSCQAGTIDQAVRTSLATH